MAMKVSTKGRYALRVLIDLSEQDHDQFVPLRKIAERQNISEKYLESIIVVFSKAGYVIGHRGKGGGYKLARDPDAITAGEVLRCVEGSLAPVACLDDERNTCDRAAECKTLTMWENFYNMINEYFDGITIGDLSNRGDEGDFYMI